MSWALPHFLDQFLVFALVLSRVSGLVMTAPVFGSESVPVQIRGLLAVALAVLVMPLCWGQSPPPAGNLLNFLVYVGTEILLGVTLGLAVNILFSGVQVAANIIGQMSGLQMAEVFNPLSDASGPVFSLIMFNVTLAVFVLIGGHERLLCSLLDTFVWLPPGGGAVPPGLADATTGLLTQSFLLAVRAAGPTMTALLISQLVLGFISRTLPQLSLNAVGFGLNSLVALGTLAVSLGAMAWIFQEQVDPLLDSLLEVFRRGSGAVSG